jgi:hypothetical protein
MLLRAASLVGLIDNIEVVLCNLIASENVGKESKE